MSSIYGASGRWNSSDAEKLSETLKEYRDYENPLLRGNQVCIVGEGKSGYATLSLTGLPAQCGMIVYHDLDFYWSDELNRRCLKTADEIAEMLGYSRALATHVTERYVGLLKDHGFRVVEEFKNKRSGHDVYTLIKTLEPTFEEDEDDDE